MSRDPFQQRLDRASRLTVDIAHLTNVSAYLTTLAEAVRRDVAEVAGRADSALRVGRYGQSYFGSKEIVTEVPALEQRTRNVSQNVNQSLADIATALTETARTVERIAARYKSAEELNRLSMAEVARLLPRSRAPLP